MSRRTSARLAWCLWALCVALAVLAVGLDIYTPPTRHDPNFAVLAGIPLLVYPTIGALIVSHRPKNAVGWVLCGMGFVFEVLAFSRAYADYSRFAQPGSFPGEKAMLSLTPWTVGPSLMLGAVLLILLFPDGKLPITVELANAPVNRMWRVVVGMAVCGAALLSLWWETWPGGVVEMLGRVGGAILLLSFVVSVISVFLRLQSAEGRERQQIKWFAYGAAVFLGAYFVLQAAGEQIGEWGVFVVMVTGLLVIPVAVGVAILRYRLYDIDLIINRTLVYGVLTATLVLLYVGGVATTEAVFRALTGEEKQPQLAVVVSTLVIAALFNPLRRHIQSFIDRRFYRSKYDARKTLEGFSAQLRNETDLNALSDDLVGVVRETIQPAHVSLWLRPDTASEGEKKLAKEEPHGS
jgi:hypothetical protein